MTVDDDAAAAVEAIDKQVDYFKSLDMPTSLKDLGELDTEALADLCSYGKARTIGSFKVLDHEAILEIYRKANR